MKRSEFLKIIAGLGLALPIITSQTFREYIAFSESFYDDDAEAFIKRLQEHREVSNDEKIAIRYYFKESKKQGIWDKLDRVYVFNDPRTFHINWVNPDPKYDLR